MTRANPVRTCPFCHAEEAISSGEAVWPTAHACPACHQVSQVVDDIAMLAPELADTTSGFDPVSFQNLADLERGHYWFVPRNRLLTGLFKRLFPNARIALEIGCGTGMVLGALAKISPDLRVVGTELHPTGLKFARKRLGNRAEFVQMDARRIEARSTFDVIGAFDVLEHIAEDEAVIAAMREALAPDGGVIITVPQHPWLWSSADDIAKHERRYRAGELEKKLAENGFDVEFSSSYCALLLPLMIASRWFDSASTTTPGASKVIAMESRPPGWINSALMRVLDAEVWATLKGMHFPFGGSRVVVARRR